MMSWSPARARGRAAIQDRCAKGGGQACSAIGAGDGGGEQLRLVERHRPSPKIRGKVQNFWWREPVAAGPGQPYSGVSVGGSGGSGGPMHCVPQGRGAWRFIAGRAEANRVRRGGAEMPGRRDAKAGYWDADCGSTDALSSDRGPAAGVGHAASLAQGSRHSSQAGRGCALERKAGQAAPRRRRRGHCYPLMELGCCRRQCSGAVALSHRTVGQSPPASARQTWRQAHFQEAGVMTPSMARPHHPVCVTGSCAAWKRR
jgi:hypothetical protein